MPPKPNYSFEKRQREMEKKKKKAEKAMRKANGIDEPEGVDEDGTPSGSPADAEAPAAGSSPSDPA